MQLCRRQIIIFCTCAFFAYKYIYIFFSKMILYLSIYLFIDLTYSSIHFPTSVLSSYFSYCSSFPFLFLHFFLLTHFFSHTHFPIIPLLYLFELFLFPIELFLTYLLLFNPYIIFLFTNIYCRSYN